MLVGSRCSLRPPKVSDLQEIAEILNDIRVKETLRDVLPVFEGNLETILKRPSYPTSVVFVVESEGEIAGICSIDKINWVSRNAYISIALSPRHWGKGIGKCATKLLLEYAFEYLNLHKINLEVYEYNERAIKLYESLGFTLEGRLRKNNYRHGRYHDVLIMGMLAEEYFGRGEE